MAPYSEANLLIQEIMAVSHAPASTKTTNFPIDAVEDVQKRRREAIVISDSDDDSTSSATKQLAASPNIAKQVTIKPESNDPGSGFARANSIQQEEEPLKESKAQFRFRKSQTSKAQGRRQTRE
jgi:hypothetical protein